MSQENVEVVRRSLEAYASGDRDLRESSNEHGSRLLGSFIAWVA
jgi:hypothetical protein